MTLELEKAIQTAREQATRTGHPVAVYQKRPPSNTLYLVTAAHEVLPGSDHVALVLP